MLRFSRDSSVPATNNLAERVLHLYKIQRKISGYCRSVAGAVAQANLRTMLETAHMQGWNVLETLEAGPAAASTKLKTS
ncbi:MAG: transposase [Albidovulum sp.]|nr:transposase [Albidovulum sp.]